MTAGFSNEALVMVMELFPTLGNGSVPRPCYFIQMLNFWTQPNSIVIVDSRSHADSLVFNVSSY